MSVQNEKEKNGYYQVRNDGFKHIYKEIGKKLQEIKSLGKNKIHNPSSRNISDSTIMANIHEVLKTSIFLTSLTKNGTRISSMNVNPSITN